MACDHLVNTADTSQTSLRYIKEECWGDLPTSGDIQQLRFTGESLGIDRSTTQSEEIRGDRQITDLIATKIEASGDVNGELSYTTYEDFMAGALGGAWKTGSDFTASNVTVVGGRLKFGSTLPTFVVGQAIKIFGLQDSRNNRIVAIKSINTSSKEVTVAPALHNQSGGRNFRGRGLALTNASIFPSFTIEKEFSDVSKFLTYSGMTVSMMSLNVEAEDKVTISFSFMGKNGATPSSTMKASGHDLVVAPTTDIMTAGTQGSSVLEGNTEIGVIKSLSLEVTNNLRGKTAIGTVGNVDIGTGRFVVTGSISTYFEDFSIYQKYLQNTSTSLVFTVGDSTSGSYVIHMPNVKFTESSIVAGGPDQDVMVDGGYQALMDPVSRKTLIITKITV